MEKHEVEARGLVLSIHVVVQDIEKSKVLAIMQINNTLKELNCQLSKLNKSCNLDIYERIFFYDKIKESILCI